MPSTPRLRVAAASSLRSALPEIISEFNKTTRGAIDVTYGSSGTLAAQIASKAPFDVFLSADEAYPIDLVKSQYGVGGSIVRYATGRLALWVPNDSPLDLSKGLAALEHESVRKIAIANPKLAPYGVAAEEALKKAGIYERVKDRLVLGENISQTAQFVESGAAQAGLISLSLLTWEMKDKGRSWTIPETEHSPIIQSGCITTNARDRNRAEKFMEFIQSEPARKILRSYGFGIPGE